ncbi:hypothetical protein ACFO0A_11245 [Novosphingobium tardum]|uniref:Uncharacterized protein n=1 Tax=Novosphingobium tardum TaxID=1538021 RepID=A0ABV8RQP6_9SPHN
MTRPLVLTSEDARHPFRRSLRPSALRSVRTPWTWPFSVTDVREFLLAYCACFVGVSAFIA